MNAKQFQRYLARDGGCVHCGEVEAVAPHHRANRGMGGSKARDVPSNVIVMCSAMNTAMESDSKSAEMARRYGWKLRSYDDPAEVPVYYQTLSAWVRLDDQYNLILVDEGDRVKFF